MGYRRKLETHAHLTRATAERLLTPEEAALYLGVALQTLSHWRTGRGQGPKYCRIGRNIRYPELLLREWVEARIQESTTENERFG
ncbi:MAG: helix-turn-helix domain-containing protein [Alphaproteobacteria bacterium]|nr:helix-turn-helix domain-containing protein [Alphaproteobacteria bacterium]